MDVNSRPSPKPSLASLLSGIICDAKHRFAYELRSAKLEVENVVDQAVRAIAMTGGPLAPAASLIFPTDLSHAAARALGMVEQGTAGVRVELISLPNEPGDPVEAKTQ